MYRESGVLKLRGEHVRKVATIWRTNRRTLLHPIGTVRPVAIPRGPTDNGIPYMYRVFNQLPEDPLTPYSGNQLMTVDVVSCSKFNFITEIFEVT